MMASTLRASQRSRGRSPSSGTSTSWRPRGANDRVARAGGGTPSEDAAQRERAGAGAARDPVDAPGAPRVPGQDHGTGRPSRSKPLLARRRGGEVGGSRRHRHGRGARGLRLADAAPPRPHQSSRAATAQRLVGRPERPAPERDRACAPPPGSRHAKEEAPERVVERARDAYETARARMVEEQLVRREITDERVIAAMRRGTRPPLLV